ncbi:MAG: fimbrillin family protein [Rikenellaceae bacterium]
MKKLLFLAAGVVMLAACAKTEISTPSSSEVIEISTLYDRISKSANDTKSDYVVYAEANNAATTWLIADTVNTNDEFTSGNIYYWPGETDVTFYAYAPAVFANSSSVVTPSFTASNYEANTITIAYQVPSTAKEDFTVATPVKQQSGQVSLEFTHMLSKLNIKAALSEDLSAYTIDSYGVKFSAPQVAGTATITDAAPAFTAATDLSDLTTYSAAADSSVVFMVCPQTSTGCTIQLTDVVISQNGVEYKTVDYLAVYTILSGDVDAGEVATKDAFVSGYQYDITLTITSSSTGGDTGTETDPVFDDSNKITLKSSTNSWITTVASTDVDSPQYSAPE